ncbi:MAG: hemerythrin domain-containing protein [Gammaproteobacteria bacterium]|nr:hemerythrin domain-containing protein [Gammaproteobacteria bacterium]MDP2142467.1 hemerythrin domain-containing protein [Gammaproteobacteria bacterium]MDP2346474.1 hemerythrin domain-containing protein [Gammaproteobacteria bacterium]
MRTYTAENRNSPSLTPESGDVITLLERDHRSVEDAFRKFENMAKGEHERKKKLADGICDELLIHMTLEEEILYPAIKQGMNDAKDIVNEGIVEHSSVKALMKKIKAMKGNEELFDTTVMVLAEQIEHHVKEEEKEMFPKVQRSKLDIVALGEQIAQRKLQLS